MTCALHSSGATELNTHLALLVMYLTMGDHWFGGVAGVVTMISYNSLQVGMSNLEILAWCSIRA
eukprot:CAMPEP_0204260130 /NCGR_PEP_ID=MMETSP0468-20130131/6118_1 /ASSEMBLY_ACC=CAM_ASM_000383 /TAXON_ID=2969 /ORGANISM="Oxyrrhis marina" /LENGTH=63 /DNA_ID=CAMNT_0051234515 /DNA_START=332 /DNA_END=523 /DNA_ORIENTATION=+